MTREERHEVYKKALELFMPEFGLCGCLYDAVLYFIENKGVHFPCPYDEPKMYPEIRKHKPNKLASDYWFPRDETGDAKRITILKQAIEETRP